MTDADIKMTLTTPDGMIAPPFTMETLDQALDQIKGKKGRMKNTPADEAVRDQATPVAAEELRQFIERFERLEAEKKDITDTQKEVMTEAKGRGYDTKILRKIIAIRKRDAGDVAEEQAVMDLYMSALGM